MVAKDLEKYEVVTVTEVGKPGTQTRLAAAANAGATSIRVMNAGNISVGDIINLDIDSKDHGVETVTVKSIDTQPAGGGRAGPGAMAPGITNSDDETFFVAAPAGPVPPGTAPADGAGRGARGGRGGRGGGGGGFGRGGGSATVELTAPLKFSHSANLPFSVRGTGITFQPATAFAHSSNEPVLPLGTGITLDKPLSGDHDINAVVHDTTVTDAGYQGTPKPNVWFGGPAITNAGSMVLRDANGLVADSLNFGGLVDPWAAEGYQGRSPGSGCSVPSPVGGRGGRGRGAPAAGAVPPPARSAARTTDGADTDSNCADFQVGTPTPGAPNHPAQ